MSLTVYVNMSLVCVAAASVCMTVCMCVLAEVCVVLKVDSRIVGRTHWRPQGNEAWGQSFSIELERVSGFHFNTLLLCVLAFLNTAHVLKWKHLFWATVPHVRCYGINLNSFLSLHMKESFGK